MKLNKTLFKSFLSLLIVHSCSDEIIVNETNETPKVLTNGVISFEELPEHIKNKVLVENTQLKTSKTNKGENQFGDVNDTAIIDNSDENNTVYTVGLESTLDGFYYDNIIVSEDLYGNYKTNIIRYTPNKDWFINTLNLDDKYKTYTGEIEVFDNNGNSISSIYLSNGISQDNYSKSNSSTARHDCKITDIQDYGYVDAYGGYYLEGVNITVECGGSSGGNGSGSEGGNGNNNDYNDNYNTSGGSGGGNSNDGGGRGQEEKIKTIPIRSVKIIWGIALEELSPDYPIEDLESFLDCYNTSLPAIITIYADQPLDGSSVPIEGTNPGHAFISISQNGKTNTFGFYPKADGIKSLAPVPSIIGNNGGDSYDVSISKTVSGSVLSKILDKAKDYNAIYHYNIYNCTNYARDIGNIAGMNIPSAWGVYPGLGGGGQNPRKLGQVMRSMEGKNGVTVNTEYGSIAPNKGSGCN